MRVSRLSRLLLAAAALTLSGCSGRSVGLTYPLRPGDTLRIGERWF